MEKLEDCYGSMAAGDIMNYKEIEKIQVRMNLDQLRLTALNNPSCEVGGLLELEKYYKETYEDGR